jgi:nucleotide-binding universal stress UspA family protein
MKKVLVPTDFSTNAKAGIRFALQWSAQENIELVFIHVLHILRASRWTNSYFIKYAEQEELLCNEKFEKHIDSMLKKFTGKTPKYSKVIINGISPDLSIMDYCRKHTDIDYVCISTRGAGKVERIFGTNTGSLITRSEVPVVAIPKNYRVSKIQKVMYASDFKNYEEELTQVVNFTKPLKASLEVLHFSWPNETDIDIKKLEAAAKTKHQYKVNILFENNKALNSTLTNIRNQVSLKKPSVLVMFTQQNRSFFQKIFQPSKTEQLSFQLKVPMLIFNKK